MFGKMSARGLSTHRMAEPGGAFEGSLGNGARSGLIAGARIATSLGWRPVEALAEGDLVLTFDAGLQPVTKITRTPIWANPKTAPRRFWSLHIPAGALGNRAALDVLPGQYVMIESDAGEKLFGDPFSLIKADVLDGLNGIHAAPVAHNCEAVVLHFETDQVVFDQSGLLYYCPSSLGLLGAEAVVYKALTPDAADVLLTCIEADGEASHLWAAAPSVSAFVAA